MINVVIDNGGRRSGIERRIFLYSIHIPELRSGKDRRISIDRRNKVEHKSINQSAGERRSQFTVFKV
ncbi:MAG: hypothetical protein V3S72_12920 [Desulfobacterales bacterium]